MEPRSMDQIGRASRVAALLTLGAGILIIATLGSAMWKLRDLEQRRDEVTIQIAQRETELKTLDEKLRKKTEEYNRLVPKAAAGFGFANPDAVTPAVVTASLNASDIADRLASSGRNRRSGIEVNYYPRDLERAINQSVVLPRLRDYGFTLRQQTSRLQGVATNAIWCGADVDPDDVKLVALTLMTAGVEIKAVRQFRDAAGPKRRSIEIGADAALLNAPPLSVAAVSEAVDFRRQ